MSKSQSDNPTTTEADALLISEMLVALKEALRALDGDQAVNSRGMVAYAIARAEGTWSSLVREGPDENA